MSASPCSHLASIQILEGPDEVDGCDTCLAEGGTWLHLRMCMACGVVGCCDDSPGRHARQHAESEGHPVVRSIEPGESWSYCFVDDAVFHVAGAEPAASPPPPHSFYDNREAARIELWVGSELVGWIEHSPVGEAVTLTKTEIVAGNHGLGYRAELVMEAIRVFGEQGKPLIPSDEFARAYIAYRPELHGAVAARMRSRLTGGSDDS